MKVPEDYKTVQEAILAASAGDTILLAPGTYMIEGKIEVPKKLTIASNYLNSKDKSAIDATVLKASKKAGLQWFDIGPKAKGTKIIGLTFLGNAEHSLAIRNSHTEVSHCKFVGGRDQLSFEGGGGLVAHCYFEGAGDDAIDADLSVSWTAEHCTIRGSRDDGIEIRLHVKEGPITTHIVRYNTFTDGTTGIQLIDYEGDSHRKFEIYGNVFKNTRSTAVDCTVDTGNRNVDGSPMVEKAKIFSNTIDGCRNGITMAPNLVILNNIFTNTMVKGIIKGKHLEAGNTSIVDYCLFFKNGANYDKGLNMGKNIFTFDPQYSDTTSYKLSPNSRAIDMGIAAYR
ncbi:MAG: right-handed parallel beta-helix repeat-containing protein [Lentisphaeria bacterium]|nr:right-handed parallel beta-helix repeat-containing protein [Lentisphaeria bacterium]